MLVRELVTKFGFKTDETKVKSFDSSIKSATIAVTALVAAVTSATTAIFFLVRSAAKTGDELDKIKDVVGLTTKQIQLLSGAAELSGVAHDNFIISLQFFAKSVGMARMGMMEQMRAFQMLGISLRGANGQLKTQHELLLEVADGFQNRLTNSQDRATVAQLLFSRGGGRMINMLQTGSAGIQKLTNRVDQYGFIMDGKGVKQSAKFTDQMFLAGFAVKSLKDQIGLKLMPVFGEMLKQFLNWVKINKQIIVQDITKFFKGIIVVTKGVAKVFGFLIATINNLVAIFKKFNQEFGIGFKLLEAFMVLQIVIKINLITKAFAALEAVLAIIEAPIVLISAAFVALLLIFDDINAYMEGKDSLIGRFVKDFPNATKAIGFAIKPIKTFLEDYIIDPLEWILHLIDEIQAKFMTLAPKGIMPAGTGSVIQAAPFTGLPTLDFGGAPWGSGAPIKSANNININTNVNLGVPAGTPDEQKSFLISSAKDAFHSNFSNEIKKALTVFPGVEK